MSNKINKLFVVLLILTTALPVAALSKPQFGASAATPITFTILHTNDFHGQLESSGSNPGLARTATIINGVRTAKGAANTLLLDAGDEMQGSLLSNLNKGKPVIDLFNFMDYTAATFGNHEFDWGQTFLISRTTEAAYPFVSANIVVSDTGSCATAGWTVPSFTRPWITTTVGTDPNKVVVGIIGVTTQETPYITIASSTVGLCFKDPKDSILHYYDMLQSKSDFIVVLSHLGLTDGGYGYGISVYGDQTLAKNLIAAGKPVPLIIGGHSHTDMTAAAVVTGTVGSKVAKTWIAQAHYNGRKVGEADVTLDKSTGDVNINWTRLVVNPGSASVPTPEDPDVKARIATWSNDAVYQAKINTLIGYTQVPLVRNYNGDSMMADFIDQSIYDYLNHDGTPTNDADMFFNNAGGIRSDITTTVGYPYTLTYGLMFNVLPFGNQTIVGDMTGIQIQDLINQSATLKKGALQPAGMRYKFFFYGTIPASGDAIANQWGSYDIQVYNKNTHDWDDLDMYKTYRVATNEFLAPAGQDFYAPFKYMTNISYWGDMLDAVNSWVSTTYTIGNPYNGPGGTGVIDNRIFRNGGDAYTGAAGEIIPLTILHHNDSHGNLLKGAFVGYDQLVTLIKQERAKNPSRTILLNGGDQIQGDAMEYYFKTAPTGFASDGTPLPADLQMNPMIAAMNSMNYSAMTLGNHEFNFGGAVFVSTFKQANFPILGANVSDTGAYGLAQVPVEPSVNVTVGTENIKVGILGITNHRVPNYELPSNIPGLTFSNPIATAAADVPALRAENDVVIALTHIGFTTNPKSVEVDNNVDTYLAAQVDGIDAIIGSHSHTNPTNPEGGFYKYLPALVANPSGDPVIINQAYRYNSYLGEVILGLLPKTGGGFEVITRAGTDLPVTLSTLEDADTKALLDPFAAVLATYNAQVLGKTTAPIDTLKAFIQETNGANLQADASVYELAKHGITVDFHLSGAMTNKLIATTATASNPYTLTVTDMFAAMPYENSLVAFNLNGPQLKRILERAYRNYYYYNYVPGYGGYSYYTTCMIDINSIGRIWYQDTYPALPNGNNVYQLIVNGKVIDFKDYTKYYKVSTVNYLAAGSCNNNDGGVTIWPLDQITNDTQYYVRDAVIDYVKYKGIVSPSIEGRLIFTANIFKKFLPVISR